MLRNVCCIRETSVRDRGVCIKVNTPRLSGDQYKIGDQMYILGKCPYKIDINIRELPVLNCDFPERKF